jgi:hypothetical protein
MICYLIRCYGQFSRTEITRELCSAVTVELHISGLIGTASHSDMQQISGVPRGGGQPPPTPKFRSFDTAEPNSHFRGKYIRNNPLHPESMKKSNRNPWLVGLAPPDPRSLCPLSSTEFVEPLRTKFLGTPLQKIRIVGFYLKIGYMVMHCSSRA